MCSLRCNTEEDQEAVTVKAPGKQEKRETKRGGAVGYGGREEEEPEKVMR